MSYSTSNPPRLVSQPIAGVRLWQYVSTDPSTDVDASGYFTDGYDLGMRDKDVIFVIDSDSTYNQVTMHSVIVSGTTVNLSTGVSVGGAADAD